MSLGEEWSQKQLSNQGKPKIIPCPGHMLAPLHINILT